jgi:hypothetical protein
MRGIDHLVLATGDLAAARARYAALGFTLTPDARHPFGTGNFLVQLQGSFLEIVTVFEPEKIPPHVDGGFSFGAFNRNYLKGGDGFSMLGLESRDALADHEAFRAAGLQTYEPFAFTRQARLPSGEEATVGFALAFTSHPEVSDAGFFTCQQRAPQHFWKPEYQRHANTAEAVADVWFVAEEPLRFAEFFQGFAGTGDVTAADGRVDVYTGRGVMVAATPRRFEEAFELAPPTHHRGPRFAGYTIRVRALGAVRRHVEAAGVSGVEGRERLALAPEAAFGTVLAFTE